MQKTAFFLLLCLFTLSVNASSLRDNSCLQTEHLNSLELFELLKINPKGILSIEGQVTKLATGNCNSELIDDFWLNGGVTRSGKIYESPIITKKGLCKSRVVSFSGTGDSWTDFYDESFVVSKDKNCMNLSISEYIEIHSPVPDESVIELISSSDLAINYLKKTENINTKDMRVFALGVRSYDDLTNYYLMLGIPGNSAWYKLPVRLSYSNEPIVFLKPQVVIE